ncbi:sulfotransferase [Chloroflexota bacterium]
MPDNETRPILITGAHRSGTTWVGKMLAASGEAVYISEPLNIWHRPGILRAPVNHWYTYICEQNQDDYLPAFQETLRLQYHVWEDIKSFRRLKDLPHMLQDSSSFFLGSMQGKRPLLKDPFAVFSAPWFEKALDCQVVIIVRHPAAIASSIKRLDWSFDFEHLLAQPHLMNDLLEPYRNDMLATTRNPQDVIGQSGLLWRIIYQVVTQYESKYPQFLVVRHEDMSLDPIDSFHSLYNSFGLSFSAQVKQVILKSSSQDNPGERADKSIYTTRLNSQANLNNWKHRLDPDEITRLHSLTKDTAAIYYSEESWQ